MSRSTIGSLAIALCASLPLVACEQGVSPEAESPETFAKGTAEAPGATDPMTGAYEEQTEATRESLEMQLGALEGRLDALEDVATGPQQEQVDALAERRDALADRIESLGDEPAPMTGGTQAIETELRQLDEEVAMLERELLPDVGTTQPSGGL